MPHLFEPLTLRQLTLPNRIGIPPMCTYSAKNGIASDFHLVHYGSRAIGGAGLLIVEATAVVPEGRISPADLGLWDDAQVAPLSRITRFMSEAGTVPAIQLAHAGRKASVDVGWAAQRTLRADEGGWLPQAPSALPFSNDHATPQALDEAGILHVVQSFAKAAIRAKAAGFSMVEIHAAHGYLLHQFLSPLTNQRTDRYGGSFENRIRLTTEVVTAVRAVWPQELPLLVRLSATDWVDGGWNADETIALCRVLKTLGVDLVDVSTGGLLPTAKIPVGTGFQTTFSDRVRREAAIPTAAVGLITAPEQADHIVQSGQADMVLIGREMLRNPQWPLQAAQTLGKKTRWPLQYLRAAPAGAV